MIEEESKTKEDEKEAKLVCDIRAFITKEIICFSSLQRVFSRTGNINI